MHSLAHNRRRFMCAGSAAGLLMGLAAHLWQYRWVEYTTPRGIWFTGMAHGYDQSLYAILVNAILQSPTGLTYAYPYALPDMTMPPVIFNGVLWIVSLFARVFSMGAAFEWIRVIGCWASGYFLAGIVWELFPFSRRFRVWTFVYLGLAGATVWIAAIPWGLASEGVRSLTELPDTTASLAGLVWAWKSTLVQNVTYPLECAYHALAFAVFYFMLTRQHGQALGCGVFLMLSHPFTSAVVLGAVVPWLVLEIYFGRGRRREASRMLGAWIIAGLLMLLYYGVFLASYEPVRLINESHLSAGSEEPLPSPIQLLTANLPWLIGLIWSVGTRTGRRAVLKRPAWRFVFVMALVVVGLTYNHVWLGASRRIQPYHFNRGYLHLALVALFMRMLWVWKAPCRADTHMGTRTNREGLYRWVIPVLFVVTFVDTVFWAIMPEHSPHRVQEGSLRKIADEMTARRKGQVFAMIESTGADVYIAANTGQIPYFISIDQMVAPWNQERIRKLEAALFAEDAGSLDNLGLNMAVVMSDYEPLLLAKGWHTVLRAGRWCLMLPK